MNRSNYNQAEREMVGYLLGEMSDDERAQFELRYFVDDALFEQMLLVKDELIDAYVRDHLDAELRVQFERSFLTTPEGKKEVALAHALRQKLNEPKQEVIKFATPSHWTNWFESLSARHFGIAAVALLLLFGIGWLWKENRKLRAEFSAQQAEHKQQLQRQKELERKLAELPVSTPLQAGIQLTFQIVSA